MRVLIVSPYFPPETGAAPARALHFARAVLRAGHEVRVITGMPNHPGGEIQAAYRGRLRMREVIEGIPVERVWLYASPRKSALRRLWNHLSFALCMLPVAMRGKRPDVVVVSTPPLFHGVSAWLVSKLRGAPLVNDCRDDWPHAAIALGEMRPGLVSRLLDRTSQFFQRRARRVLVVTPGMRRQLESRGYRKERLLDLPNGADTELFQPPVQPLEHATNPSPAGFARSWQAVYAGTHGLVHGMESILDAAALLKDDGWRFLFIGEGVVKSKLMERVAKEGWEHVEFRPSVPPRELVSILHESAAALATTRGSTFAGETIPVKIFDYMAVGCPLVAAVTGDAAQVVNDSGAGLVVSPEDGNAMADALRRLQSDASLRQQLSQAGPAYVRTHYSRLATGKRFVEMLSLVHQEHFGKPIRPAPQGIYQVVKRTIDVCAAMFGLILLSPVMLAVALAVKWDSPGPALFKQTRIGRGSRHFTLLKFRSMSVGTPDVATHLLQPGSVQVTRVGRFIRKTSLDELPQLWNVLKGEMSLVGPRPALYNQYDLIQMREACDVHSLRPGVTGLAQVSGRDELPLDTKVAFDREYLERVSFLFDLELLWRTFGATFTMRGVKTDP